MTTIRATLLIAAACLSVGGCTTTVPDAGGVLSSLGAPRLGARDCAEISRDAAGLAARVPGEGAATEAGDEVARAVSALREEAEGGGCQISFDARPVTEMASVPPAPTMPVEVSQELLPPAGAEPTVEAALPVAPPAVAPVVDISIPNVASRSAWDAEPLPVGVAGLNPGSEAARQGAQRQAESFPSTTARSSSGGEAKPRQGKGTPASSSRSSLPRQATANRPAE